MTLLAAAGVCQVAAVELVAVSTCPVVGAVAVETLTVVVAELRPFASFVCVVISISDLICIVYRTSNPLHQ